MFKLSKEERSSCPKIYVSDSGNDENDGSEGKPIRTWKRYLKLKTGNDEIVILGDPEKVIRRLNKEIKKGKQP